MKFEISKSPNFPKMNDPSLAMAHFEYGFRQLDLAIDCISTPNWAKEHFERGIFNLKLGFDVALFYLGSNVTEEQKSTFFDELDLFFQEHCVIDNDVNERTK